jgi:hypothetical protein
MMCFTVMAGIAKAMTMETAPMDGASQKWVMA